MATTVDPGQLEFSAVTRKKVLLALFGGFAAVLAALLTAGYVGWQNTKLLEESTANLAQQQLETIELVDRVQQGQIALRMVVLRLIRDPESEDPERILGLLDAADREVEQAILAVGQEANTESWAHLRDAVRSAGARGYLLKDAADQDLIAAVRAVGQGQGYVSPAVSEAVLSDYRKHVTDPIDLLTSREREVLQMIAEGKTNKEIASLLGLSVYTVDAHRGRIMEKLNLRSAGEIVRFAMRQGLID